MGTKKQHGNMQSYRWQATINNPLPEYTHQRIKEILSLQFSTFIFAAICDEVGNETHTYHTHVFIVFSSAVRLSTLKRQFTTAHFEACRGSIKSNIDYLKKQGKWANSEKSETSIPGTYEELGERPPEYAGKNGELAKLYEMIVIENLSTAQIIAYNPDYMMQIDKINETRTTMQYEKYKNKRRTNLEVTYVFGPTAIGKTRGILDEHGDGNVYRVTSKNHPFDEYTAEPVICFEEFRDSFPLRDMLNYLDIYVLQLPARYSNKVACFEKAYVLSNWPFENQYREIQCTDKKSYAAFVSRFHKIVEYTADGQIISESVPEYFARKYLILPEDYRERHPFNEAQTSVGEYSDYCDETLAEDDLSGSETNEQIVYGTSADATEKNTELSAGSTAQVQSTSNDIIKPLSVGIDVYMRMFYHPQRRHSNGEAPTNS